MTAEIPYTKPSEYVPRPSSLDQIKSPTMDIYCPTWQTVEAWLTLERKALVDRLCFPKRTHDDSQIIRGEIARIDKVLGLPGVIAGVKR